MLKNVICKHHLLTETFPGNIIYNCSILATNIPYLPSLIDLFHCIYHHSYVLHILLTDLFLHIKRKLHNGRDFIIFDHYCLSPISRTMSCVSGHAMNIWGMLKHMTNESPPVPFCLCTKCSGGSQSHMDNSLKVSWTIQSNGDCHFLHRVSFRTIVSFSELCFLCYRGSFGLSGASHLLKYLLLLAEGKVLVQPFKLFWLPLHGLSQRCCF